MKPRSLSASHGLRPTAPLLRLLGLFLVWPFALIGADAPSRGTIEGRVFNPRTDAVIENARVSIEAASLVTFTDADGVFRLDDVPAGPVQLRIFFTGFPVYSESLTVTAGQSVRREITLAAPAFDVRKTEEKVVKLDQFVVGETREMDAAAIAINEQRFAPNVRDVVSTDEFGAVAEGNVAEFLRYLPGLTVDLSGGDARTVSIDGAPAANTPVTFGGLSLSSPTGTGRAVEVGFFNLNNISRIEVSLSPTPDSPGSALAGSVNMVPRSSFERTKPVFNGSVYLMMRDDLIKFGNQAALYRDPRRVVFPGFDLSWIVPLNKRVGFSIATGYSTQFSHQVGHTNTWRGVSSATNGAAFPHTTPDRPYLSAYQYTDAPKESQRDSLGLTLDFRVSAYDRISLSYQYSSFDGWTAARNIQFNPAQIVPGSFTPTAVQGVAGAGNIQVTSGNGRVRENRTYLPTFNWRHDGPVWKFDGGVGRAYGKNAIRSTDKGLWQAVVARRSGVTVAFDQVIDTRPGIITVIDNATRAPVDPYRLENYSLISVAETPQRASDFNFSSFVNARRDFLWKIPFTLRGGLDFRQSTRDSNSGAITYNYRGSTVAGSAGRFLDPSSPLRERSYGFSRIEFPDYKSTLDFFRSNPGEFTTDANTTYRNYVTNSKWAREAISATYLRGDAAFFDRRLQLVGGVRLEQTNVWAHGPLTDLTRNVRRDASGRPLLDAAGRPIPVTTDALETSRLTFLPRATDVRKEYLRVFPSLNASFNVRENLIARAAISTSVGRPDFNQYAGAVTLPNTDNPPAANNRIGVNNVAIKPWSATSTKVRLEYYFAGVGQFAIGAFRRDYRDFFGSTVFRATPEFLALYALDAEEYGPYDVATQYNVPGTTRMEGWDVSYKQALTFLPSWARGIQVFANYSERRTQTRDLGSIGFNDIPSSGSFGASLTRSRFSVRLNCSFRDDQRSNFVNGASIEPGTFVYTPARNTVDVLGEYTFWRRFAIFGNLRNVGDVPNEESAEGPSTPAHAKLRFRERYGSLWTFGVKGTF
ncbi:MAG: TonB-dependent receptor [Verrucomicrobia bacterium]|nr:TonB-dependent receptor [Verrucomicrobiota bacterium]